MTISVLFFFQDMVSQKNTVSIKSTFILKHKMNITVEATLTTKLPSVYMLFMVLGNPFSLRTIMNLTDFLSKEKID